MPPEAPAPGVAGGGGVPGAQLDGIDRAHLESVVMKAGRLRADQRQHVMAAAVRGVEEGQPAAAAVGEDHAEFLAVEGQRAIDIGDEDGDVRQAQWPRVGHLGVQRRMRQHQRPSTFGRPAARYRDNLDQSPAALNIVDFKDCTRARLTLFNDTSHYEAEGLALPAAPAARLSKWWSESIPQQPI